MSDRFTLERTERTWTSRKEYIIVDGKKEVLKLGDLDEAKQVVALLNKVACKKNSKRKSVKKVSEKLPGEPVKKE